MVRAVLGAALAVAWIAPGSASAACSNADLKGAYGLSGTGTIVLLPGTPIAGPFAQAGLVSFDQAVARLRKTSFRVSQAVISAIMQMRSR